MRVARCRAALLARHPPSPAAMACHFPACLYVVQAATRLWARRRLLWAGGPPHCVCLHPARGGWAGGCRGQWEKALQLLHCCTVRVMKHNPTCRHHGLECQTTACARLCTPYAGQLRVAAGRAASCCTGLVCSKMGLVWSKMHGPNYGGTAPLLQCSSVDAVLPGLQLVHALQCMSVDGQAGGLKEKWKRPPAPTPTLELHTFAGAD